MKKFRGSRSFAAALCALALIAATLIPSATTTPARAKGNRRGSEWTVLAPVSYKNLTIFPVRGSDLAGSEAYITLDEGTKTGSVVITEKGTQSAGRGIVHPNAANRSAAVQQQSVSYSSSGASVNELALVNRSGKKLLLLAGEVVVGGKQDRVIPPVSVPVALNVFCVEHGRWTPRNTSYSGGGSGSARGTVAPMEAPAPDGGPAKFSSLGAVAHPKLRGAAQDKKAQGEVWKEVSENNARLGTANSTDTYQEVYASKKVVAQVDDYVRTLEREVLQPGVVGVVVARNGRAVWADVFASQRLFASYWPKLLKSYIVDAIGDYKDDKRPSMDEADSYLRQREGTVTTTTQDGVYQLVKTEQAAYAVFELRDISLASPLRIHFNKMDR
jgi:hypothetical protein